MYYARITTARAGLPENRVIYVHALRNAVNPLITLWFRVSQLIKRCVYCRILLLARLGLILQAVLAQDLYLVMASLVMGAVMLIVGNLLADCC